MILADPEDLGKTIQAILAIYLDKDLPGKSLVIIPEGSVNHWIQEFGKVWEQVTFRSSTFIPRKCWLVHQGYGPKVLYLEDLNVSATELLARNCDVVICKYAFFKASYKQWQDSSKAPLHTLAGSNEIPWKTVYLDQSHHVIDTTRAKHISIEKLSRRAIVFLEARPCWDTWIDVFGAIHLLRGHPWGDRDRFALTFGHDPMPLEPELRALLQRFLGAVFIARPEEAVEQAQVAQAIRKVMSISSANWIFTASSSTWRSTMVNSEILARNSTKWHEWYR